MKFEKVPYTPVNSNEHFMHAMVVRLDALCHMVDALVQHVAKLDKVTQENVTEVILTSEKADEILEEKKRPVKPRRKG